MLKTQIIGHLGKDAIINTTTNTVINFSVAHSEKFKDKSGVLINKTTWVECSYWTDKTAIAQYLKKGTQVYVDGQPSIDVYTNRDNVTVGRFRLRVNHIQLLGSANKDEPNKEPTAQEQAMQLVQPPTTQEFIDEKDGLPF